MYACIGLIAAAAAGAATCSGASGCTHSVRMNALCNKQETDLTCTYLAHYGLESVLLIVISASLSLSSSAVSHLLQQSQMPLILWETIKDWRQQALCLDPRPVDCTL